MDTVCVSRQNMTIIIKSQKMATCWNGDVPQKIQEITDSDLRYFEETCFIGKLSTKSETIMCLKKNQVKKKELIGFQCDAPWLVLCC